MQGVRLLNPTIGESIVVIGLGLVGLLSVQILRANGCQVLGIDYSTKDANWPRVLGPKLLTYLKMKIQLALQIISLKTKELMEL